MKRDPLITKKFPNDYFANVVDVGNITMKLLYKGDGNCSTIQTIKATESDKTISLPTSWLGHD